MHICLILNKLQCKRKGKKPNKALNKNRGHLIYILIWLQLKDKIYKYILATLRVIWGHFYSGRQNYCTQRLQNLTHSSQETWISTLTSALQLRILGFYCPAIIWFLAAGFTVKGSYSALCLNTSKYNWINRELDQTVHNHKYQHALQ